MDPERTSFTELLENYRAGDPEAIAALFASYNEVIRVAVRRRLPYQMRQEFDSLDFAQDVWASFCAMPKERTHFSTPEELNFYLSRIAMNKVTDSYRRRLLGKGVGFNLECPITPHTPIFSPEPTGSQWVLAGEKWAAIVAKLPPPHVAVVERIREGYTQQEVADMAGISLRTVTRIVDRVQRFCEGKK